VPILLAAQEINRDEYAAPNFVPRGVRMNAVAANGATQPRHARHNIARAHPSLLL
jgi:hypothetical protein